MAQVILKGAAWTSAAPLIIEQARREVEVKVAAETAKIVRAYGQASFRYESSPPTLKWMRSVHPEARNDYHVATDRAIIYGHWLEGTGTRNRTTRFKGYFMWRRAFQYMERVGALKVAEPIVARAVRALNG
jgi:hypothetical protein